jgi:starch synthase
MTRILLLTEGDAERWDSWSGSAKSVVDHLRKAGHEVKTADVDLYGPTRMLGAALSFSPNKKRWGVRYHLGPVGYRLRSEKAASLARKFGGSAECILQIGATFKPPERSSLPYFLFCDSNIQTSVEGAKFGVSDSAWLRPSEFDDVRRRESAIYRGAAAVLTMSEFLRRSFINDFGLAPERVHTVGAAPNLDVTQIPEPRPAARTGVPTVLFVGKQFERKGGATLLEAFRQVRTRVPEARLVLIGPPTAPSPQPGVEWLGNLDKNNPAEKAKLLQSYLDADVFCLPSLFEPFGIVILEAMLFGLPCVGTAAWAIPEMIADGETGYTFARGDAGALADRLTELLTNRDLGHRMGIAGRKRALEWFSWDAVASRMTAGIQSGLSMSAASA